MNYITDSVRTIVKVLSIVVGEGFSTGSEETLIKYHHLVVHTS